MNPHSTSESEQAQEQTPVAAKFESERQACDLEFFSAANIFAEQIIEKIPELQAVAIVPLWAPQLENVPTGILRLRDETPPYLGGLLQMLGRIAAFTVDIHRDLFTQIKAFDRMASNLVAEIKTKTTELQNVNQQHEKQTKAPE